MSRAHRRQGLRNERRFDVSSSFTPKSLAGLIAWYRADLGVTVATGVSAWADQSGSGDANRNAIQNTAANQPTLTASDALYNNRPTINNTSGTQYLATPTWGTTYAQPTTILVCGTLVNRLVDGSTVANRQAILASVGWAFYAGTATVASATALGKGVAAGIFNGASSSLYVNSSAAAAASGNPGASALNILGILNTADGVSGSVGEKVAEIACYSRALSTSEISAWFRYANARYAGAGWS